MPAHIPMAPPRGRAADGRAAEARAVVWRAAWLGATLIAGFALAFSPVGLSVTAGFALLAGAAPAMIDLLVPRRAPWRSLTAVAWAIGGATAAALTGGVSGPMAAWCLAPIAAAALGGSGGGPGGDGATGAARRMAEGATLSLMGAAVAGIAQLAGLAGAAPPAGQQFWLGLLALSTTALGVGAGLIVNGREARDREAERARESRALLRTLEAQPYLLLSTTLSGKVRQIWGPALEGAPSASLMRGGLEAIGRPEDAAALAGALATVAVEGEAEVMLTPRTAQDRTLVANYRRLGEDQILIALRDATAQRAREAALEQQRGEAEGRAAGRSRFLANMSHELRTPLNAIMGFSDIMRSRMFGPLSDRYGEYAELIHESGRHLLDLISDLLDMSKIEAERYQLDKELFDAREAVTAALRLMRLQADAAGVTLRGVLPPGPLEIDGDRRALKQIVLNLLSNALKFTPKGGQVTVTAHIYEGQFELIVADTGVGISPEDLVRLGRPFEQAGDSESRAMGSGLGLSLVRAFAELHGGQMILESRLGAGATVTVRLPAPVTEEPDEAPVMDKQSELEAAEAGAETASGPTLLGNVIPFFPQR
jgi:cell cycle sensor histidine kinase DivJ